MTAQSDSIPTSAMQANNILFRPARGRWQWQALGLALGAFAAVLAVPRTGRIAREHVGSALPVAAPSHVAALFAVPSLQPVAAETAARRPDDVGMAVASALRTDPPGLYGGPDRYGNTYAIEKVSHHQLDGELMALRDVMRRFPDSAVPRAAFLRFAAIDPVTLNGAVYEATHQLPASRQLPSDAATNSPLVIGDFLQAAQEGERIEPENAFFPTMAAVAHLIKASRSDRTAYVDLDHAARLSNWDDHSADIIHGLWRLDDVAIGMYDSGSRCVALASLPPVTQVLNDLGAMVDFEAIDQVHNKHREVYIALNSRLARIAALIRAHTTGALDLGSSDALFQAARVGELTPGHVLSARETIDYVRYLRAEGFGAEADWIKRVDRRRQPDTSLYAQDEARLLWMEGWFLLVQCVPFILIGGFLAVRRYQCRFDQSPPRPLASDAIWGSALGFLTVFGMAILSEQALSGNSTATLTPLLALILLGSIVGVQTMLRRTWLLAQAYGLTALCLLAFVPVIAWTLSGEYSFLQVQAGLSGVGFHLGTMTFGDFVQGAIGFTGFFLVVPGCFALLLMIVSRLRRVPVAAGVARGFGVLALPCITLLLLTYVGFTFHLSDVDNQARYEMEYALQPNPRPLP